MSDMVLKLPQYFYLLMKKTLGHYIQVWFHYYQAINCNQNTPILYPQGNSFGLRKPKKYKH